MNLDEPIIQGQSDKIKNEFVTSSIETQRLALKQTKLMTLNRK